MTAPAQSPNEVLQHLLGRAAVYQLLAFAFGYPDEESLEQLRVFIEDVAEHPIAGEFDLQKSLSELGESLNSSLDALAIEHTRLFAGDVLCSPYETGYDSDGFIKTRQLADISGFYGAFGVRITDSRPAPADFIATQLEFMSLLALKESFALEQGMVDEQQIAIEAQRAFLEDHLGRWAAAFCKNVAQTAEPDGSIYPAAAALLLHFVRKEIQRVDARPQYVIGRPTAGEDVEMFTCGLVEDAGEEDSDASQA
jgi:putative dimethyl sulfoxide reductase chaperone